MIAKCCKCAAVTAHSYTLNKKCLQFASEHAQPNVCMYV